MFDRNSAILYVMSAFHRSLFVRDTFGRDILLLCDDLPLNGLFIIGSATCRTESIYVVLDIVEAELADLTA